MIAVSCGLACAVAVFAVTRFFLWGIGRLADAIGGGDGWEPRDDDYWDVEDPK